jgi:hypothetical protein
MACGSLQTAGPVQPVNSNQVAANRQLPPADPNQALLQVIQQNSFENAVKKMLSPGNQEMNQCKPTVKVIEKEKTYTCKELEQIMINRCQLQNQDGYNESSLEIL